MEPIETTQHALEFAGPAAPGWLLALIPAALIIVWSLYRYQFKDIGRFPRTGLLVLRCLTVAGILFLVFRPIIVFRRVLTYPGRILMVIDDSESMSTADNRLSPRDALYVARRLDTKKADVRAEYHKMAELLRLSVNAVKRFQEYSRKADRRLDAFWTEAERIKAELTQNYDAVEGFLEKPAKDPAPEAEKQLAANLDELCQKTTALFAGERHPGREQFDALYEKAASIMAVLLDLQAALDAEQLAQPAALQRRYLAEVQASKRTDLLAQALTANLQKAKTLAGNQFLVCISLMTGQQQLLGVDSGLKPFATVRGETDLVNALTKLAVEENSFPLTAIVLLSDGRDLGKGNLSKLKQELTRRRIPLHAAGIGDLNEPYDLAVVDVVAPPLAVKGEKVTVKAHLKAVLPEPRTLKLSVLGDGQLLTTTETLLGKQERQDVDFTFIPQKAGISLYSITAETMQGEAFPRRNNKADFAMDVRTEPVRVLLLDWKPRWETRFACTVLRNLGYVELNQIILMAQPNELKRGVGRGCWPDSFDALNMYDLLILGDVPDSVLTEAELSDVRRFVQDAGKAICLLSPETPAARQLMNEFIPMPKVPAADSEAIQLAATPAGQVHPMSYRYMPDEHATPAFDVAGFLPDTQVLVLDKQTRQACVAARFPGKGRAICIGSQFLWRDNHKQFAAHRETYTQMVAWAIQAGIASDGEQAGPTLVVDNGVFDNRRGFQVWVYHGGPGAAVEMYAGKEKIGEVAAEKQYDKAAMSRAAFINPRHGNESEVPDEVHFALKGHPDVQTRPIVVVDDYRELDFVAQDQPFLQQLAGEAGGMYRPFVDIEDFFQQIEGKARTEEYVSRWRLWDSTTILVLMAALLTAGWIWRKLVGLV